MNSLISDHEEKGGQVMMMQLQVDGGSPTNSQMQDDDPAPYMSSKMRRRYKECLKNHAASVGGNAVDGCGEFLPGGDHSLNCSACGCHRNFHRKELPFITTPMPPIMHAPSSSDISGGDIDVMAQSKAVEDDDKSKKKKRRRFRTKFSKEQKEKLAKFAERAGWKMQKLELGVVEEFCREIGIHRKVLKVWMHNNKHKYSTTLPHF